MFHSTHTLFLSNIVSVTDLYTIIIANWLISIVAWVWLLIYILLFICVLYCANFVAIFNLSSATVNWWFIQCTMKYSVRNHADDNVGIIKEREWERLRPKNKHDECISDNWKYDKVDNKSRLNLFFAVFIIFVCVFF